MRAALQGSPITDRSLVYVQIGERSFSLKGRIATSCARCDVAVSTRMVRHLVSITDQALCTIIIYNVWLQDENVKQLLCAHCPKCYFELRRQYTPLQEIDERTGSLPWKVPWSKCYIQREEVYHDEVWPEEVPQSTVNWVFLIECYKQWMQMQLAKGSEIYQPCGDGRVF